MNATCLPLWSQWPSKLGRLSTAGGVEPNLYAALDTTNLVARDIVGETYKEFSW